MPAAFISALWEPWDKSWGLGSLGAQEWRPGVQVRSLIHLYWEIFRPQHLKVFRAPWDTFFAMLVSMSLSWICMDSHRFSLFFIFLWILMDFLSFHLVASVFMDFEEFRGMDV